MQELDTHGDVLADMKIMCLEGRVFDPNEYREAWALEASNDQLIRKIKEFAGELVRELLLQGQMWSVTVDMYDGQIYVTVYNYAFFACMCCHKPRLVSPQTGCCRACDEDRVLGRSVPVIGASCKSCGEHENIVGKIDYKSQAVKLYCKCGNTWYQPREDFDIETAKAQYAKGMLII